jgi:hypothetical protein
MLSTNESEWDRGDSLLSTLGEQEKALIPTPQVNQRPPLFEGKQSFVVPQDLLTQLLYVDFHTLYKGILPSSLSVR